MYLLFAGLLGATALTLWYIAICYIQLGILMVLGVHKPGDPAPDIGAGWHILLCGAANVIFFGAGLGLFALSVA